VLAEHLQLGGDGLIDIGIEAFVDHHLVGYLA
jgi:hypothetical protein